MTVILYTFLVMLGLVLYGFWCVFASFLSAQLLESPWEITHQEAWYFLIVPMAVILMITALPATIALWWKDQHEF